MDDQPSIQPVPKCSTLSFKLAEEAPLMAGLVGIQITVQDKETGKFLDRYRIRIDWYREDNKSFFGHATGLVQVGPGCGENGDVLWLNSNASYLGVPFLMRIVADQFQDEYLGVRYESELLEIPARDSHYPIILSRNYDPGPKKDKKKKKDKKGRR